MMWDWWSSRPQHCLKFGADSLAWAKSERGWRGQRRRMCLMSPLPNGLISPSPLAPNFPDLTSLADRVHTLTSSGKTHHVVDGAVRSALPRRITVLLPDTVVRATVLQFEQLPTGRMERDNLIRWRLRQEQLVPLNDAKIVSQTFHDRGAGGSAAYTVLTVSIQEAVLKQYESLCESVGLIPYDVGITSLRLLDFWKRVSSGSEWFGRNVLWVNLFDRSLTTIVCRRGRPIFYRCKLLGEDVSNILHTPDMLHKILEECSASLEVCHQRHPSVAINDAVICAEAEALALQERIEGELQLAAEQFDWKTVEPVGRGAKGHHREMASLAALAGLP
ncbi:MAG: hypothetical protein OEY77_07370 [Nitrospira sp.]|nr:hypothetical protein [Nitrospira sp.]